MSNKFEINKLIDSTKSINFNSNNTTNNNRNSILLASSVSTNALNFSHSDIDMSHLDEKEKKIINEYVYLLEKSRQLFNGLRDLPQNGHKSSQWNAYFGRTFDVYTKLWKFQQQNRQILDQKYNLKRWQIGEIASKIGQLYYHYYLRTSESNYLNEAYSFYQAIETRAYYSKANKEEKPDLMVKKLRFYARFIVVCMLLKKTKQIKELVKELSKQIDDYLKTYDPEDQLEWQMVLNEINDFIEADSLVSIDNENNLSLSNRLNPLNIPVIGPNTPVLYSDIFKNSVMNSNANINHLSLQEIIIIGNCHNQIKFSELSLDMYRMLQACEKEPSTITHDNNSKLQNITNNFHSDKNLNLNEKDKSKDTSQTIHYRENPHKYILYKPSFSQFYSYISSSFKDLPPHGVMLIYLSADSCESHTKAQIEHAYDFGGVRSNNKKDVSSNTTSSNTNGLGITHSSNQQTESNQRKGNLSRESHCIYPGDLYPFLRKPIFLIVDSFNSSAFKNFPCLFGQPFVSLLSPSHLPNIFNDRLNQQGNLFTLFLTNPLVAFCYICSITNLPNNVFQKCQDHISLIFVEIAKSFYKSKQIDSVFIQYCNDDFLRSFILRYVFCYSSLYLHRGFKGQDYYPSSQPQISNDIIENKNVQKMILDLAIIVGFRPLFLDVNDD